MSTGKHTATAIRHLELDGITKRFPGVLANDNITFDIRAGEVHALLGENGAGKSTLMKILFGLYQADSGEIRINGAPVRIKSPADALGLGIGMIHQHFQLVPTFTVAENVALGLPSSRGFVTDLDVVSERIRTLSKQYGVQVDPSAYVWTLAVGQQQRVEILKALYREASVLILDEPTAVLTPQEVDDLFVTLRELARSGRGMVFISHKLHEVIDISDRVTVLRNGRVVGEVATRDTTKQDLARMMVGREVITSWDKADVTAGRPVLEVQSLSVNDDRGLPAVRSLSLNVRAGEIIGIAGVSGNGQRELAEAIAGMRRMAGGTVQMAGRDLTNQPPAATIASGIAYIPEERMTMGCVRDFTVAENAILETHTRPPLARGIFMDFAAIEKHVGKLVREFDVKTPSLDTPVKSLSGGNIQKLIMGRELGRGPQFLLAAQPTRGVDIGATEYIHKCLLDQRAQGTAILLISEDLDEVLALSDQVAVMYEGEIVGLVPPTTPVEELGLMMAGGHRTGRQSAEAPSG